MNGPELEIPPAPPIVRIETAPAPPRVGWKTRLAGGALCVAGAMGLYAVVDDKLGLPNLGWPDVFDDRSTSGQAETAPMPETQVVEEEFEITCRARVSAGVRVKGKKDFQVRVPFTDWWKTMGTAFADKITYGDSLLCGETGTLMEKAQIEKDVATGEVRKVTVNTDGLVPTHARVNHLDWRNCVPLRYDYTTKQIEKAQREWEEKAKKGKDKDCDDGLDFRGTFIGEKGEETAEISKTADAAVQVGLATDAIRDDIINGQNENYRKSLAERLQKNYPGAEINVTVNNRPDERQQRIDRQAEELRRNYFQVEVRHDPKDPNARILHLTDPGGSEVDVRVDVGVAESVQIDDIKESQKLALPAQNSGTPARPAA